MTSLSLPRRSSQVYPQTEVTKGTDQVNLYKMRRLDHGSGKKKQVLSLFLSFPLNCIDIAALVGFLLASLPLTLEVEANPKTAARRVEVYLPPTASPDP